MAQQWGTTNKTKPQHHATLRHNTPQQTRQQERLIHNQRLSNGAQRNMLYNAKNGQVTTHNILKQCPTPHTNVQPHTPKHNTTTQHATTQHAPEHKTPHDKTQHQTNPDATRQNGHHETHNPIHARNDTQHNKATQRWYHLVPTQNTTRHNALQPHTATHNVNSTANNSQTQPYTTTTT